jgi:hypothetical protein
MLLMSLSAGLTLSGCGGAPNDPRAAAAVVATHGGELVTLPDGKGFVELVVEAAGPAKSRKGGEVAAYFLKPDGFGPIEPAPTDVIFTTGGGPPITLAPQGDHFVSEPGPYTPGRGLSGELSATVGGGTVKVLVRSR